MEIEDLNRPGERIGSLSFLHYSRRYCVVLEALLRGLFNLKGKKI